MEKPAKSEVTGFRRRILVVEDNEINQSLIKVILEKMNQDVDIAGNGLEAISILKKKDFDIIFMDIEMPELDGISTVKILRNDLHMEIPVIALTANSDPADIKSCLMAGMNDIMTKPYSKLDFTNILNKWVGG